MKYVVETLGNFESKLAKDLIKAVIGRYCDRRNEGVLSLMLFLQNGSYPQSTPGFQYSSKAEIKRLANSLLERLFSQEPTPAEESQEQNDDVDELELEEPIGMSIQDKINELMKPSQKPTASASLDKDIKMFETTKEKSQRLEKLYNALFSIQPTSTSCEQAFSVTGSFKTKVRNLLGPKNLNVLAWLNFYFANLED